MPVMEGVGDEVLVVVGVFVLLCIILLAWLSTHTRDIPFVSVIIIELSQRRQRSSNSANNSGGGGGGGDNQAVEASRVDRLQVESPTSQTGNAGVITTGANNNADSANVEDCTTAAATSKASDCSTQESTFSQPASSRGTRSEDLKPSVPSHVSEPSVQVQDSIPEQAEGLGSGSVQVEAQEEVTTILPFTPSRVVSGEEVRRRRVAYFTGGSAGSALNITVSGRQDTDIQTDVDQKRDTERARGTDRWTDADRPGTEAAKTPDKGKSSDGSEIIASSQTLSTSAVTGESPSGEVQSEVGASSASGGVGSESSPRDSAESSGQQIRVRLKYLNDTQRLVYANPQETVGNFRRQHFSSELENNKVVRFIFNGQDLRNDLTTLQAYNINDNSVVHCLITQNDRNVNQRSTAGTNGGGQDDEVQMGAMLFPVFGVILGLVWYLRFTYKHYFNAMSTVSLAGISFIYILAFLSSIRHRRHPHELHLQ